MIGPAGVAVATRPPTTWGMKSHGQRDGTRRSRIEEPSPSSRRRSMTLYWKCQIAGWSFYGLLAAGIPTLYGGMRWTVALRAAVGIAIGLFLSDQLRRFILRRGWTRLPLHRLAPRVVLTAVIVAA